MYTHIFFGAISNMALGAVRPQGVAGFSPVLQRPRGDSLLAAPRSSSSAHTKRHKALGGGRGTEESGEVTKRFFRGRRQAEEDSRVDPRGIARRLAMACLAGAAVVSVDPAYAALGQASSLFPNFNVEFFGLSVSHKVGFFS